MNFLEKLLLADIIIIILAKIFNGWHPVMYIVIFLIIADGITYRIKKYYDDQKLNKE